MSATAVRKVVSRLQPGGAPTDAELVRALVPSEPDRETAFAELVRRYGPMVLGACRGVLGDAHAAEDAFQAVFLVLVRKADSIRPPGSVGGWLYGVAVRTAQKAKTAAARRRRHEMAASASAVPVLARRECEHLECPLVRAELRAAVDAELAALPEMHRAAVVLCDLHGKTRSEVALELGRAEGTVASWLARGRKALAVRLARRGVALPAAGLAAVAVPATVSAELCSTAAGIFAGRGASEFVLALAESVMKSLSSASTKFITGICTIGALLAAVATATAWHTNPVAPPGVQGQARAEPTAPLPKGAPKGDDFLDHGGFVHSVSYAPDGKTFVSVGGGRAVVWDTETHKTLFRIEGAAFARFSDDGKSFFYLTKETEFARPSADGTSFAYFTRDEFHIADPRTGKSREKFPREAPKALPADRWAAISGDGSARIELNGSVQTVTRYPSKGLLPTLAGQQKDDGTGSTRVSAFGPGGAFAPGEIDRFAGTHAATTNYKETACLSVWNLPAGTRIGTISPGKRFFDPVQAFAWSPDGKEIAVGYIPGVRVYDAATLKELRAFGKVGDTTAIAFSKDGKTLAIAVREGTTASTSTTDSSGTTSGSSSSGATGTTGGASAASGSTSAEGATFAVVLLDAANGKQLRRFEGFPENLPVISLAFSPNGKELLCGAGFAPGRGPVAGTPQAAKDAKGLRVIHLDEPEKPAPAWKQTGEIELAGWVGGSVAYSLDGKRLFVGGAGGVVHAYDTATRKKLWEYKGEGTHAAVAVDGTMRLAAPQMETLAVTGKNGIRLLDPATGKLVEALEEKGTDPVAVAWFPDRPIPDPATGKPLATSRKLITGTASGYTVKMWSEGPNVNRADTIGTIHSTTVAKDKKPADVHAIPLAVAGSGRGAIVTGPLDPKTEKNVLWVWSAGSGAGNQLLEGHKVAVVSAAWSQDDTVFVTGDVDGLVLVWDAATAKVKARVNLGGRVAALALSTDAKHIAAAVVQPQEQKGKGAYTEEVFVWPAGEQRPKPEPVSQPLQAGAFAGLASVAFAPDGESLAVAFANLEPPAKPVERNGWVRVFALQKKEPEALTWVQQIVASPDGKRYAVVPGGVFDASGKKLYDAPGEAVSFSPDSRTLFAMGTKAVLECDADTGKVRKEHPRPKTNLAWHFVRFSPDGKRYAAHFGFNVRIYDTATGFEPVRLSHQHEPGGGGTIFGTVGKDLIWSADGKQLAAVGVLTDKNGKMGLAIWDTETGNRNTVHDATLDDGPLSAAFTPDGDRLAIGGTTGAALWVVRGDADKNPERHYRTDGPVTAIAFAPDGKSLALGVRKPIPNGADAKPAVVGHKAEVWLLNTTTGEEIKRFDGFEDVNHNAPTKLPVHALAFVGGNRIAAGTGYPPMTAFSGEVPRSGELKLFDLPAPDAPAVEQKWTEVAALKDAGDQVNAVAVSPDGMFLAATGTNGMIALWDAGTRQVLATVNRSTKGAYGLAFSPDSKALAVGSDMGVLGYELPGMKLAAWSENHVKFGRVDTVAFSPDGTRVAMSDGYVTRVRSLGGKELASFGSHPKGAAEYRRTDLAWSPDGKWLALPAPARDPEVWHIGLSEKGEAIPKRTLTGPKAPVTCVAWSKDGKLVVAGDEKGNVFAWDPGTGKELWQQTFRGRDEPRGRVNAIALSPADGTIAAAVSLFTGKGTERVVLLAPKTGKAVSLVMRGSGSVTSVAWAPDGTFFVTGHGAIPGEPLQSRDRVAGSVAVWERRKP